jgi:hypothetical protein
MACARRSRSEHRLDRPNRAVGAEALALGR